MKTFQQWLSEYTGVVFGYGKKIPKIKNKTFNVWGAPGSTGVSIKGEPIKNWLKKK